MKLSMIPYPLEQSREKARFILEALLIALAVFFYRASLVHDSFLTIFQVRDIHRAQELAAGNVIFFGPEQTGTGFCMGPFAYFLLALPLRLGLPWISTWYLTLALSASSVGVCWYFCRFFWSLIAACICLALGLTSLALTMNTVTFFSSGLVTLFVFLAEFGIIQSFSGEVSRVRHYWLWACFVMGLAIQLHSSAWFLLLSAMILQLCANRFRIRPIPGKDWYLGLAVLAACLAPYWVWAGLFTLGIKLGQSPPPSSGVPISDLMQPFVHWKNHLRAAFIGKLDYWSLIFLGKTWLAIGSVLPAAWVLCLWRTRPKTPKPSSSRGFRSSAVVLAVTLAMTAIPVTGPFFGEPAIRYGIPFVITLILFTGLFPVLVLERDQEPLYLLLGALMLGAVTLGFAGIAIGAACACALLMSPLAKRSREFLSTNRTWVALAFVALMLPAVSSSQNASLEIAENEGVGQLGDYKALADYLARNEGWDFAEARKRLFQVRLHSEMTPEPFFEGKLAISKKGAQWDGYFLSLKKYFLNQSNSREWLLSVGLEPMIQESLLRGAIETGPPVFLRRLLLIPYRVKRTENYSSYFSNFGEPYQEPPAEVASEGDLGDFPRVAVLGPHRLLFLWNEGYRRCTNCVIGALVESELSRDVRLHMHIKFVGNAISAPSNAAAPAFTQQISDPFVEIVCDRKRDRRKIAGLLGAKGTRGGHKSILAPFEREVSFDCSGDPEEITLGWNASRVTERLVVREVPARALTFRKVAAGQRPRSSSADQ